MAFCDVIHKAVVRVVGRDARAFVHRLSTQHVAQLQRGEVRLNAFTNDKGRVVDVVHHIDLGDDGVMLVGLGIGRAGRGAALAAWLDRFHFSEALELIDESDHKHVTLVWGPGNTDLAPAPLRARIADDGAISCRSFDLDGQPAWVHIANNTSSLDVSTWGERSTVDAYEAARIRAGVVGASDFNDKWTPLDLALNSSNDTVDRDGVRGAVHWNKGCYIGQEVIARLDTYGKQHKRLFRLTAPQVLHTGASVLHLGQRIGEVLSVATNAHGSDALAVLKLPGLDAADVVVQHEGVDAAAHASSVTPAWSSLPA